MANAIMTGVALATGVLGVWLLIYSVRRGRREGFHVRARWVRDLMDEKRP